MNELTLVCTDALDGITSYDCPGVAGNRVYKLLVAKESHGLASTGDVPTVAEFQTGMAATGGIIGKSGSYLVGEDGPEIVTLPGNSNVTPNGGSMQSGTTVNVINNTNSQIDVQEDKDGQIDIIINKISNDITRGIGNIGNALENRYPSLQKGWFMISEELKKIYSSNPYGERYYETLELSHSRFSKTFYLVKDNESHLWELEDSSEVTFVATGMELRLPEVGSAQQDISVSIDNVGREMTDELESAVELINEPIKCKYRVYIDGDSTPQSTVLSLVFTSISMDMFTISATATRADLYKKIIPSGNKTTFDSRFIGLFIWHLKKRLIR